MHPFVSPKHIWRHSGMEIFSTVEVIGSLPIGLILSHFTVWTVWSFPNKLHECNQLLCHCFMPEQYTNVSNGLKCETQYILYVHAFHFFNNKMTRHAWLTRCFFRYQQEPNISIELYISTHVKGIKPNCTHHYRTLFLFSFTASELQPRGRQLRKVNDCRRQRWHVHVTGEGKRLVSVFIPYENGTLVMFRNVITYMQYLNNFWSINQCKCLSLLYLQNKLQSQQKQSSSLQNKFRSSQERFRSAVSHFPTTHTHITENNNAESSTRSVVFKAVIQQNDQTKQCSDFYFGD